MNVAPPKSDGTAYETGNSGETFVAAQLARQGWSILARNWRAAGGELDLVVERAGVLRFVEVKTRGPLDDLDPTGIEAVHANKQRRLIRAANAWLDIRGLPDREVAFLVALVRADLTDWSVEWLDNAF